MLNNVIKVFLLSLNRAYSVTCTYNATPDIFIYGPLWGQMENKVPVTFFVYMSRGEDTIQHLKYK